MKKSFNIKELRVGLVLGLVSGWCFAVLVSLWFGWPQLDSKDKWDFGIKIIGGSGALAIFLWSVNQWFLTKKIEFEKSILSGINERHEGWVREKATKENANVDGQLDVQIELTELHIQSLLVDEAIVRKQALSYKELRFLYRKYLGTPTSDMDELWNSDALKEQVEKIKTLTRKY